MKTIVRICAVVTICFETAYAQPALPVTNPKTADGLIEAPKFHGGERWEYQLSPRRINECNASRPYRFTISVHSVDPDGITLMSGTTRTKLNAGLAELQEVNGTSNIQDTFNFPIVPGKKWEQRMLGKYQDGNVLRTDLTCEHNKLEKVTVPAGEFDAFPIVCKGRWNHLTSSNAATYTYWYSPTVKNIVKREVLTYWDRGVCVDSETLLMNLGAAAIANIPPKTNFAPIDDETRIPYVRDTGRVGYKTYLTKPIPRAFAIAPNGAWGWGEGEGSIPRALDACSRYGKDKCKLYSVDDFIVWKAE